MPYEPRITKYGMPASETQRYETAQTAIAYEAAVLKELLFLHALAVGPSLRAALDALAGKGVASAPMPATAPPSVVIATPAAHEPVDLRAALGLQ